MYSDKDGNSPFVGLAMEHLGLQSKFWGSTSKWFNSIDLYLYLYLYLYLSIYKIDP